MGSGAQKNVGVRVAETSPPRWAPSIEPKNQKSLSAVVLKVNALKNIANVMPLIKNVGLPADAQIAKTE